MRNRLICLVLLILLVSVPAKGIAQKITLEQAIEEAIIQLPLLFSVHLNCTGSGQSQLQPLPR